MTKSELLSIATALLILTDLSGRNTAVGADDPTLRLRTDLLVRPYLDNDIIVGMTIGVLRQGKREVFGYGRMSRDNRRVPDGDTIFELGSATKVLTGILLADAVVRGQVKLNQPARAAARGCEDASGRRPRHHAKGSGDARLGSAQASRQHEVRRP